MRAGINHAAAVARGELLAKCDAHCMFAEGWDEVLKADLQDNQIVIPRRKRLDAENWAIRDVGKPDIDLHYLTCPLTNKDGSWTGPCTGGMWAEGDGVAWGYWLTGSGDYAGYTFYQTVNKELGQNPVVDGVIYKGAPPKV